MSTRRLPNSYEARYRAIKSAKDLKDAVPPPTVIPFTPATIVRMDTFLPLYKTDKDAVDATLQTQLALSPLIKTARRMAEYLISDFFSAQQRAIRRGRFEASVRPLYGLAGNDANLPRVSTEADVLAWGENASEGEAARIAAPADPITFPAIAEVDLQVGNFRTLNQQQANAKLNYDAAQETLAAQNPEADKLILKMWNEIETAFDEGDKASMRRKAREWGVVYVPTKGETPSPEDYSIMGQITAKESGNALPDVEATVVETDETVTTDTEGNYFIGLLPDGSYTLRAHLPGYEDQTLPDVNVSAGNIATINIGMDRVAVTGTLRGNVKQARTDVMGATISLEGVATVQVTTDMDGNYILNDVPVGPHTIRATLPPAIPGAPQTLGVEVMAGMETIADFNF